MNGLCPLSVSAENRAICIVASENCAEVENDVKGNAGINAQGPIAERTAAQRQSDEQAV